MDDKKESLNLTDEDIFKEVFNSFFPYLTEYAKNIVLNNDVAIDMVQEVFLKLWKYRKYYTDFKAIRAFLYKTVRNDSLNYIKHTRVENKYRHQYAQEEYDESSVDYQGIKEEAIRLLHKAINDLPSQCKSVILLSVKGLMNQEIAGRLGVSVNTVKTQKKIAYSKLRNGLDGIIFYFFIFS